MSTLRLPFLCGSAALLLRPPSSVSLLAQQTKLPADDLTLNFKASFISLPVVPVDKP